MRWLCVDGLAKKDTAEAALLCAVSLDVAVSGVVREILGHCLMGVKPHLAQSVLPSPVLGEGQQPAADALSLRGRRYSDVLQQEVILPKDEHSQTDQNAIGHGYPHLAVTDGLAERGSPLQGCIFAPSVTRWPLAGRYNREAEAGPSARDSCAFSPEGKAVNWDS